MSTIRILMIHSMDNRGKSVSKLKNFFFAKNFFLAVSAKNKQLSKNFLKKIFPEFRDAFSTFVHTVCSKKNGV